MSCQTENKRLEVDCGVPSPGSCEGVYEDAIAVPADAIPMSSKNALHRPSILCERGELEQIPDWQKFTSNHF